MPARSYDARHRASTSATAKPRRLLAGLALPTAAAAALTFTATGAAVATKTQVVTFSQNALSTATPTSTATSTPTSTPLNDPRSQAIEENALAIARENAGAAAARSDHRKSLAARALAAKRVAQAQSWQLPLNDAVRTSDFGWRWGRLHAGDDFAVPIGTDLVSMSSGTVTFAGEESGYGVLVKIRYWDGTTSYYAHMSSISVADGEIVEPGDVVGQSGNSGHSTGPHLHLEIHPDDGAAVDPAIWLADHNIAT